MGHFVTGLIAGTAVLEAFSRAHSLHQPIALAGDLAILPLREIDLDAFGAASLDVGIQHLSARLMDELRHSSRQGPLMYFETEYHGGAGGQGAAVFLNGELIYGPQWDELGPINHGLMLLGVQIEPPAIDEFDTVGLQHHRSTDDWLTGGWRRKT